MQSQLVNLSINFPELASSILDYAIQTPENVADVLLVCRSITKCLDPARLRSRFYSDLKVFDVFLSGSSGLVCKIEESGLTVKGQQPNAIALCSELKPYGMHGSCVIRDQSGWIMCCRYLKGELEGVFHSQSSDGQDWASGSHHRGKAYGPWEDGINGRISYRGSMANDEKVGIWHCFDPNGKIYCTQDLDQNMHSWYSSVDGRLRKRGPVDERERDAEFIERGVWSFYYKDGALKRKGMVGAQGEWSYYYRSGRIAMKGVQKDGAKVGEWLKYDDVDDAQPWMVDCSEAALNRYRKESIAPIM